MSWAFLFTRTQVGLGQIKHRLQSNVHIPGSKPHWMDWDLLLSKHASDCSDNLRGVRWFTSCNLHRKQINIQGWPWISEYIFPVLISDCYTQNLSSNFLMHLPFSSNSRSCYLIYKWSFTGIFSIMLFFLIVRSLKCNFCVRKCYILNLNNN